MDAIDYLVHHLLNHPETQLNGHLEKLHRVAELQKCDDNFAPIVGGTWNILKAIVLYNKKHGMLPPSADGLFQFVYADESARHLPEETLRVDTKNLLDVEFDDAEKKVFASDINTLVDEVVNQANQDHVNWILSHAAYINTRAADNALKPKWDTRHGPADALNIVIDLAMKAKSVIAGSDGRFGINTVTADTIEPEVLLWLWEDRIPGGKVTLWAGQPGTGKSACAIDLIARVTTGQDFPDGKKNAAGAKDVLVAFSEDDESDTYIPRLMAAGADLERVHIIRSVTALDDVDGEFTVVERKQLQLKSDTEQLKRKLAENPNIALVVLDPISSYFGDINPNRDEEVRPVMHAIQEAMSDTKAAFIGIIHNNKRSDAKALEKILGASSIVGVARAVWAFLRDDENKDEYTMSLVKGNLSRRGGGLRYTLVDGTVAIGGKKTTQVKVEWGDADDRDADQVMADHKANAADGGDSKKMSLAKALLTAEVKGHPRRSKEIYDLAEAEGLNSRMVKRAAEALGIVHNKQRDGWYMVWGDVKDNKIPDTGVL